MMPTRNQTPQFLQVACLVGLALALGIAGSLSAPPGPQFGLATEDTFTGNSLDKSKWDYRTGTRLDGYNLAGNVAVSNGVLHIYGRNETNVISGTTYNFTCGGIITKQSLGYGYYEIQAILNPSNLPGWHQSFWSMAVNEVDGFEIPSYTPTSVGLNLHYYPSTGHYGWGMNGTGAGFNYLLPADRDSSMTNHVYGWEYTPNGVNWFVDGMKVMSSTYPGPLEPAHVWITSVAYNEGGAGIVAPSDMQVDYFRFYTNSLGYGDALPSGTLVDITSATFTGTWATDANADNYNLLHNTRTATNNGNTATWTPSLASAGSYEVLAWNPSYFQNRTNPVISGARQAQFKVTASDGAHLAPPVDQIYGGQKWISLGTFPFNAGTGGTVRLTVTNSGSVSIHRAGAVVFRRITNAPATPSGLSAVPAPSHIALTWRAPVGWSSFNVKRSTTSGGPYTTLTNVIGFDWNDLTATNATAYFYIVSATNVFGESPKSTEVVAIPVPAPTYYAYYDFASGNSNGWVVYNGNWRVVADVSSPSGFVFEETNTLEALAYVAGSGWSNYTAAASLKMIDLGAAGGVMGRFVDINNFYLLRLAQGSGSLDLMKKNGGVYTYITSGSYVKWATPFDGELPASALYLRHVKGVRLENVRLAVEKPDARAFIAGDDIEGLTLQGVVASAPAPVPGLAKLADAKDVTEKDCRVECGTNVPVMVTPTADELRRLAELRTRSAELDREIQQKADEIDAAAKKNSTSK